jgi:hypothetical protein
MEAHKGITEAFSRAFRKLAQAEELLAEDAKRRKKKHRQLVFLLDLIPTPVILANALTMGLRTDMPAQEGLWSKLDMFFLGFYCIETAVRVHVYGCPVYCFGPDKLWNWFDVCCILLGVVDGVLPLVFPDMSSFGNAMLLKMLRLLKLARLVKTLHYPIFAELKFMIQGVASGMRVLLWALVLLSALVYFLGVTLANLMGEKYEELSSVTAAMFTVFRCLTDGCAAYDGTPFQERVRADYGMVFIIPYVLTIMMVIFGLFNLIMAVFVGKIGEHSARRKQQLLGLTIDSTRKAFKCSFARFIMRCKVSSGRSHHNLTTAEKEALALQLEADELAAFHSLPDGISINRQIFNEWLKDENFVNLLDDADVDISNMAELFVALDADMSGSLTPSEIVEGLMKLRGPITKIDMIGVLLKVRWVTSKVQDIEGHHIHLLDALSVAKVLP